MIETSYVLAGSLTGFVVGLTGVGGGGAKMKLICFLI